MKTSAWILNLLEEKKLLLKVKNVLNEFPERHAMGITGPFFRMSNDKDIVIKNISHHCCIYIHIYVYSFTTAVYIYIYMYIYIDVYVCIYIYIIYIYIYKRKNDNNQV